MAGILQQHLTGFKNLSGVATLNIDPFVPKSYLAMFFCVAFTTINKLIIMFTRFFASLLVLAVLQITVAAQSRLPVDYVNPFTGTGGNKIINSLYSDGPAGLCGNEDCGQMSAWYVFSCLGFYPVNPVDGRYYFGSPQFEKASVHLPNGKILTIIANKISPKNIYLNSIKLNYKSLNRNYLTYNEIQNGGILEFEMTDK